VQYEVDFIPLSEDEQAIHNYLASCGFNAIKRSFYDPDYSGVVWSYLLKMKQICITWFFVSCGMLL
jgi:hypothetical protein